MNDVVKYHNHFNSISLKNFNSIELNLLMAICSQIRDKGIDEITLNFSELKNMVKYKHRGNIRFVKDLEQIYKKLITLSIRIETKEVIDNFVLFTRYRIIKEDQTFTIKVNEDFKYLLNNLVKKFTQFELEEFIHLKSNYSKEIYRRLKQFKSTGFWKIKIEDFKELLNIPEKYRMSDIDKYVLKISRSELENHFKNFEIIKIKKGRKIEYIEFKFTPEKKYKENIADIENKLIVQNKVQKRKISEKIIPARKTRIIEVVPKQEKEKTLREKIEEKISENDEMIVKLEALYAGLKDKVQFKKITEKYPKKIEKIKNVNMQLKAIYDTDENELTQEIIELAEELLANKV
ncbi:replication initiation protein [Leptotrichia alba]|uniref:Replication initiation protein n=1 Tax=Leptotrichia alba TaxID=3239304 RepID=A0AB39V773_9FUSO